jgi:hypothetical protein
MPRLALHSQVRGCTFRSHSLVFSIGGASSFEKAQLPDRILQSRVVRLLTPESSYGAIRARDTQNKLALLATEQKRVENRLAVEHLKELPYGRARVIPNKVFGRHSGFWP